MPRALSMKARKKIDRALKQHPSSLGARLGSLMAGWNVPAAALAKELEVTPDTVYRWAYNDEVPEARYQDVKKLIAQIEKRVKTPLRGSVHSRRSSFTKLLHGDE